MLAVFALAPYALAAEGQMAGVGLALAKKGEDLIVHRVLPSTPAAAGRSVKEGDRILSIAQDNQPPVEVKALKFDEAVALIRGPQGTTVWLTVVPKGEDDSQARSISFVRGELKELARWGDGVRLASGTQAPDVSWAQLSDSRTEHLADHAGRILVLEFWAISCGPCQKIVTDLQGYAAKYPAWKDKVVLIAVNVDEDKAAAKSTSKPTAGTRPTMFGPAPRP
jgi:thiol-disulfide isomerase/thioredoxin